MKTFKRFLNESRFTNWVKPDTSALELEYKVEFVMKGMNSATDNVWPDLESFLDAANSASVVEVDSAMDRRISYRSGTKSFDQLHNLIKSYRSYPEFRNEKTLRAIYDGFAQNKPMKMPIVLRWPSGKMRVLGGNTRMDVAFQMGIKPKVLMMEVK